MMRSRTAMGVVVVMGVVAGVATIPTEVVEAAVDLVAVGGVQLAPPSPTSVSCPHHHAPDY